MFELAAKWSTAYGRFGLGARGGVEPLHGDPRAAIEAELSADDAGRLTRPELLSSVETLTTFFDYTAKRNQEAKADAARLARPPLAVDTPPGMRMNEAAAEGPKPPPLLMVREPPGLKRNEAAIASPKSPLEPFNVMFQNEAAARIQTACAAQIGFVERLVAFWSNHFCVSAAKGNNVRALAGAFEREAIRPFVLGRFDDMLRAVETHPAMLYYLDNTQSTGPSSKAGKAAKRGLNENFAREILELHTLGANAGYAQADVTEFARILTGWTVAGREGKLGVPGTFAFNANAHEGGARKLLGRAYEQPGLAQGVAALDDIARRPETATHIAAKFASAFVADDPSAALVGRLAEAFRNSDGDLGALARALVADEEAWSAPPMKIRDPWQMTIAAHRALGLDVAKPSRALNAMAMLGMPLWAPGGPNGFSGASDAWLSPEGIKTRVGVAAEMGRLAKDALAPADLVDLILPGASEITREAVLRAESRDQAYALMILSPEFQRI